MQSGEIAAIDPETGKVLRTLVEHEFAVRSVAFTPDGTLLGSGSDDMTAGLWDLWESKRLRKFEGHLWSILGVAFDEKGRMMATGSIDDNVGLWNVDQGSLNGVLNDNCGDIKGIKSVTFVSGTNLLAIGCLDGTILLRNTTTGEVVRTLSGHNKIVHAIAYHPDRHVFVTGGADGTIRYWGFK